MNFMQWKQLAQAGRRKTLLSKRSREEKLTEKQEAWLKYSNN